MITLSKSRPQRGSVCHRCQVIRLFVIVSVGLAIFALVADDKLHYLQAVTPMRAAVGICLLGILGLAIKFVGWKLGVASEQAPASFASANQINTGHEQAEPPVAASEKTGRKSSH